MALTSPTTGSCQTIAYISQFMGRYVYYFWLQRSKWRIQSGVFRNLSALHINYTPKNIFHVEILAGKAIRCSCEWKKTTQNDLFVLSVLIYLFEHTWMWGEGGGKMECVKAHKLILVAHCSHHDTEWSDGILIKLYSITAVDSLLRFNSKVYIHSLYQAQN